jgi:hypothetical protein
MFNKEMKTTDKKEETRNHKDERGNSLYEEVYSDFEYEKYLCSKCGDTYKLWYEDMQ